MSDSSLNLIRVYIPFTLILLIMKVMQLEYELNTRLVVSIMLVIAIILVYVSTYYYRYITEDNEIEDDFRKGHAKVYGAVKDTKDIENRDNVKLLKSTLDTNNYTINFDDKKLTSTKERDRIDYDNY